MAIPSGLGFVARPVKATSGSYSGDDSANRAIPHSLGVAPKIVFIIAANYFFRIITGYANVCYQSITVGGQLSVTAMNATNFYVGNASNYSNSANVSGTTYYWVAIG